MIESDWYHGPPLPRLSTYHELSHVCDVFWVFVSFRPVYIKAQWSGSLDSHVENHTIVPVPARQSWTMRLNIIRECTTICQNFPAATLLKKIVCLVCRPLHYMELRNIEKSRNRNFDIITILKMPLSVDAILPSDFHILICNQINCCNG